MRLLIITANPEIERTRWWPVIAATPGLSSVMILCERRPRRIGRSIWGNLRRHGLAWVPFRAYHLLRSLRRARPEQPLSAVTLNVPVETLNVPTLRSPEVVARVTDWKADLGVSVGAPILRPELFRSPRLGTINLHLGRAPDFRGAPPGFWELWQGAREIGATVHVVDEGLDTGPVITQATAPIYPDDSLEVVEARAEELGTLVLARALSLAADQGTAGEAQGAFGRVFRMPVVLQRWRLAGRLALAGLARGFRPRPLAKRALCAVLLTVVRPLRDQWRSLRRSHPVRIFTYHRVTSLCRDGMTLPPLTFARQLAFLQTHHDIVPLETALDALDRRARLRRPLAAITFDDAYGSVFEHARPVMNATGVAGCVFVSTALAGTTRRFEHDQDNPVREHLRVMSWEELARLRLDGWSLGSHTANHVRLSSLSEADARRELEESRDTLAERFGLDRPVLAYPFGSREDMTSAQVDLAVAVGYRRVLSNVTGENAPGRDARTLHRIDLGGDHATHAWKAYAHGYDLASIGKRAPAPLHGA